MSRSYRRPFAVIYSRACSKSDKQLAHRGVRRKQNLAVKICLDYDTFLAPHRLECHWNDTYNWACDDSQGYVGYYRNSPEEDNWKFYQKTLRK
jgi:hypothetical protein